MDATHFVIAIVVVALVFDFINGFHDSANSIATVVSTRVLSPGVAVVWAAFFNFVAAFVVGTAVAKTISKGLIEPSVVDSNVILAGLLGAILWDIATWYLGLPTSSSHALLGGYGGAAIAKAGFDALILSGWVKPILFIVISPLLGMALALGLTVALSWLLRRLSPRPPRPRLPTAPARLRGPLFLEPRSQRRAEDDGHHRGSAGRHSDALRRGDGMVTVTPRDDGRPDPALGGDGRVHLDRIGDRAWRLEDREDDGNPDHEAPAFRRILRGDGRRDLDSHRLGAWGAGQHHPHDYRSHRGRRGGEPCVGCAMGSGRRGLSGRGY